MRLGDLAVVVLLGAVGCTADTSQSVDAVIDDGEHWSVNDVSYLFPLPKAEGEDALLLSLDSAGAHGPLLPLELYDTHVKQAFGGLWEGFNREDGYEWSRIIALRVDPCVGALEITPETECVAEVRLSAQPLWADADPPMSSAIDASLHLLYRVSRAELDKMLDELLALRLASGADHADAPLGPHPIMVREGLSGPFAKGLRKIILAHVGADNLHKFTVMTRGRNSTNWRFLQLVRGDDGYARAPIPATGGADIQAVNELGLEGANNSRDTIVSPVDPAIGYPADLLSSVQAKKLSSTRIKKALGRLAGFEDPGTHSAETLDCASCHISANARSYFEKLTKIKTPKAALTFDIPPDQNVKRVDGTALSGKAMRAFGYFDVDVAISQRTINDSARVADWLSHDGP